MTYRNKSKQGFALITFLVFTTMAVMITGAAVITGIIAAQGADIHLKGDNCYSLAKTGIEKAYRELLRNPNYSGETFTINSVPVTIEIIGSNPKTINSTCSAGWAVRQLQSTVTFTNHLMTVTGVEEIN